MEIRKEARANRHRKFSHMCVQCGKDFLGKEKQIYCNLQCMQDKKLEDRVENKTASSKSLKRYLIKLKGHICWRCNYAEWNDIPITLELEHMDGDSSNNELKNLEILCPNCHSQTPTYKAKNIGKGRHSRRKRYAEGKSF